MVERKKEEKKAKEKKVAFNLNKSMFKINQNKILFLKPFIQ